MEECQRGKGRRKESKSVVAGIEGEIEGCGDRGEKKERTHEVDWIEGRMEDCGWREQKKGWNCLDTI